MLKAAGHKGVNTISLSAPITIHRKILFGDCDPAGIVYTPRFSYFALEATHEALTALLRSPCISTLNNMGILTPVRAFDMEFLSPVTWDDELKLDVRVSNVSQQSYTFTVQGFVTPNVTAFKASITYVTVAADSKQTITIPDHLVDALNGKA